MTTLDDALNSSSVVFDAPDLKVEWREMPPNEKFDPNLDTVRDLSQQMTGEFGVSHSLDDGLPDPVTKTTGNSASGAMAAQLLGREQIVANVTGWRGVTSAAGGGTLAACTVPADVQPGDYVIVAISLDSNTAVVTDSNAVLGDRYGWQLIGSVDDGATLKTWIWGRMFYLGGSGPQLALSTSQNYTWQSTAFYATTADGRSVPMRPATAVGLGETVSGTSHIGPPVTLNEPGYIISVWATTSGTWTPPSGSTELVDTGISISQMVAVTSALQQPGVYTLTASSSITTAVATKMAIPLEVRNRNRMDARSYFSPLNKLSPVYGWDRDTAAVTFIYNVLTSIGAEGTTLFTGQMADIVIQGRTAEMQAVSKTRLNMDRSLTLPLVRGDRENCTVDWFVTWLMARGGMYAGPAPGSLTRYWAPMYGSIHGHLGDKYNYSVATRYDAAFPSGTPLSPPKSIPGLFLTAMYAQQTATRTEELVFDMVRLWASSETLPAIPLNADVNLYQYDQMSLASSSGRLTFWMRGDAAQDTPPYLPGARNNLWFFSLTNRSSSSVDIGSVQISMRPSDRRFQVMMGSSAAGYQNFFFSTTGLSLPTDAEWHFIGVAWDYKNGLVRFKMDGVEATSSAYTLTPDGELPATDAALRAAGGRIDTYMYAHLPISDLQLETGAAAYSNPWTRHYPIPEGSNAIIRATNQNIQAITEVTPAQAWNTIAQLAQSSASAYRTNEEDNFEFLPLSYFGETDQMTPVGVVDTQINASDLDVNQDPSKIRNVVTVEFDEVRVTSAISTVFELTSATEIVRGVSSMIFALDSLMAELYLQGFINTPVSNLTSAEIATPSTIPYYLHNMSVNTAQDGSGTVLAAATVSAVISDFTASTLTVTFTNNMGVSVWLSNNGVDVPFLQLRGYPIRVTKAYVTLRDTGSVAGRRERPLTIQLPWVQDRATATSMAQRLVNVLARPRAEVTVTAMGDPRRRPGQLVTINDSEGTQAEGTWRILSVQHNGNGPQYTQDLSLVRVLPVALWDGPDGWDYSVWGE